MSFIRKELIDERLAGRRRVDAINDTHVFSCRFYDGNDATEAHYFFGVGDDIHGVGMISPTSLRSFYLSGDGSIIAASEPHGLMKKEKFMYHRERDSEAKLAEAAAVLDTYIFAFVDAPEHGFSPNQALIDRLKSMRAESRGR